MKIKNYPIEAIMIMWCSWRLFLDTGFRYMIADLKKGRCIRAFAMILDFFLIVLFEIHVISEKTHFKISGKLYNTFMKEQSQDVPMLFKKLLALFNIRSVS